MPEYDSEDFFMIFFVSFSNRLPILGLCQYCWLVLSSTLMKDEPLCSLKVLAFNIEYLYREVEGSTPNVY